MHSRKLGDSLEKRLAWFLEPSAADESSFGRRSSKLAVLFIRQTRAAVRSTMATIVEPLCLFILEYTEAAYLPSCMA